MCSWKTWWAVLEPPEWVNPGRLSPDYRLCAWQKIGVFWAFVAVTVSVTATAGGPSCHILLWGGWEVCICCNGVWERGFCTKHLLGAAQWPQASLRWWKRMDSIVRMVNSRLHFPICCRRHFLFAFQQNSGLTLTKKKRMIPDYKRVPSVSESPKECLHGGHFLCYVITASFW